MSFDMEECRADKIWAHFYKIKGFKTCYQKMSTVKGNLENPKYI